MNEIGGEVHIVSYSIPYNAGVVVFVFFVSFFLSLSVSHMVEGKPCSKQRGNRMRGFNPWEVGRMYSLACLTALLDQSIIFPTSIGKTIDCFSKKSECTGVGAGAERFLGHFLGFATDCQLIS